MSKPVQVFIMMGQSNMLGYGRVNGGLEGYLDHAVDTKGLYPYLKDGEGAWTQRNDVRYVRVQGSGGPSGGSGLGKLTNNHWLNVGLDGDGKIGVEQGIGHHLGQAIEAPVLLLKSAIGNRGLGWDLLPPGGVQYDHTDGYTYPGSGGSPERWLTGTTPTPIGWYAGLQYEGDVARAKSVLADIGTYYPGATSYEVAGFIWWQGDRDRYKDGHADKYEENLVRLISSLRAEFNAPDAPFVLATLGQTEIGEEGNDGTILNAMLAVDGDAGNYGQFEGNVATVYSHPLSLGGSSNGHYNQNAETYMNVGEAMGQEMVDLMVTDSDSDGLPDDVETNTGTYNSSTDTGTDPNNSDTDGDGLSDGEEVLTHGTSPILSDSDGDGFDDAFEINKGFDPNLETSTPDALSGIHTAVEFWFNAANGVSYRIEVSEDLNTWDVVEPEIIGEGGTIHRFYSTQDEQSRFFRAQRN